MAANGRLLNLDTGAIKLGGTGLRSLTTSADLCPSCCISECYVQIESTYDCVSNTFSTPIYSAKQCTFPVAGLNNWYSIGGCKIFYWGFIGDCSLCDNYTIGATATDFPGVGSNAPPCCDPNNPIPPNPQGCICTLPTSMILSLTDWNTNPGFGDIFRNWYAIDATSPMTGTYVIPANFSGNLTLATFPSAVVATGPFGQFGTNDLVLKLRESSLLKCRSSSSSFSSGNFWRVGVKVAVESANVTTTNANAVRPLPDSDTFGGYVPYPFLWEIPPTGLACNTTEVAIRCFDPDKEARGPDGGCGGGNAGPWINWPGCPNNPTQYVRNATGCLTLGVM